MENYKVALLSDGQGPVLTAEKITLTFQSGAAMTSSTNGNLVDANFTVDADQVSILRDGSTVTGAMKRVEIRGAELEKLISKMDEGSEKVYSAAKLAIWRNFNNALQSALDKALKAQYQLDNPVTTQEG
jgi:hypothetical protein